jgi:hypothetical protein
MKNLIMLMIILSLYGCETLYTGLDNVDYQQELSDLELQYQQGKITYPEYQEARRSLQDSYTPKSHVGALKGESESP